MTDEPLKLCPFCGGAGEKYPQYAPTVMKFNAPWSVPVFAVYCQNCGATGGHSTLETEAILYWNDRAEPIDTSSNADTINTMKNILNNTGERDCCGTFNGTPHRSTCKNFNTKTRKRDPFYEDGGSGHDLAI